MGLFDFLKNEKRDNGQTFLAAMSGIGGSGGVAVTDKSAMTFSAVYAAVRILSESIASLPINLYKKDAKGNKVIQDAHPVQRLISLEPNKIMTSYNFRAAMVSNLVLKGNAYAIIHRDGTGRPNELQLIDNDKVKILHYENELFYEIKDTEMPIPASEMLHFVGLNFDGIQGKNPIEVQRDTIGLSVSANKYGGNFYKNAAAPQGILMHPGKITREAAERLKASWNANYAGVHNAHRTALLEEGMQFKTVTLNPADVDFLNTRKYQVNEIARIFRIPPHLLGSLDNATYANIEQQQIDFVMHTLRPYLINIEQELCRKLLRENEKRDMYIKMNVSALLRGDSDARAKYYQTLNQIGVLSINEIRSLEDLSPVADGDIHYYPLNFAPIGTQQNNEESA